MRLHLHLLSGLNPYVKKGVLITEEDHQNFEVTVPVGHVTIRYQTVNGLPDEKMRLFWIGKGEKGNGWPHCARQRVPLLPGTYNIVPREPKRKSYDRPVFMIGVGEEKEIILRSKS